MVATATDPNAITDPTAPAAPAKLPAVSPVGAATQPATTPQIAGGTAGQAGQAAITPGSTANQAPAAPALPTVAPISSTPAAIAPPVNPTAGLPAGWSVDPKNPSNYTVPSNSGTADTASIPQTYNGMSTATPGYAQDQANLLNNPAGGTLYTLPNGQTTKTNPGAAGQQTVQQAIGTAAGTYTRGGQSGVVVNGTDYAMNPDGTFTGGGQTLTADQVKALTQQAGTAGVQQHIDTPQIANPLIQETQADLTAQNPMAILAGGQPPIPQAALTATTPQGLQDALKGASSSVATPASSPAISPASATPTDQGGQIPANLPSLQSALQQAAGTSSANPTPAGNVAGGSPNVGAGVSATPTDPTNPLTNQTLSVSGLNDPLQMALQQWQTGQTATAPQFQADLRDALRAGAAAGGLGSGTLNTSLGNIESQRNLQGTTALHDLISQALQQQNANAYANEGIAAQQQGFQAGQQQTAFNQNLAGTQEQSALNATAFAQALQQLTAGSANNPAQMKLVLSQIFGQNAAAANAALGALVKSSATNSTTSGSTSALQAALQAYIKSLGGGGTTTGTNLPPTTPPNPYDQTDPSNPDNSP